jgi:Fe-S-cluster-containing dehydrogenase component
VKVSTKFPGGDLVLSYLSRGQYFGELALLSNQPHEESYKALDHVEIVRFDKEEFEYMIARFPDVGQKLRQTARRRAAMKPSAVPSTIELRLNNLLEQGLMDAQNVLMIDLDSCTRCDECVHACAEAHDGVTRLIRDGLRFDNFLVATSCRQCTDPMCMIGCPVGSIRRRDSLEVVIEDWCIGCDKCAKGCPYGNISMHEFDITKLPKVYEGQKVIEKELPGGRKKAVVRKATTCDLCLDLPEPSCVYACPHNAAIRGNPSDIIKQRVAAGKPSGSGHTSFIPLATLAGLSAKDAPAEQPKKKWFSFPWGRKPQRPAGQEQTVPEDQGAGKEPRWRRGLK